jgi:5-methylcytosine-specific restriction endonuclease McrA
MSPPFRERKTGRGAVAPRGRLRASPHHPGGVPVTAKTHGRSGRPWRELRLRVLREEPYCQIRGPKCRGIATTVDHVVPLSVDPSLAHVRANLRSSCGPCNYAGGARLTNARRRGYLPPPAPRPTALCFWPGTGLPCSFTCGGSLATPLCRLART